MTIHDQNVQDAASMAYAAIDEANIKATIATMRAAGKSDEEIAEKLVLPLSSEEERQLMLILLLVSMGDLYQLDRADNMAMRGFTLYLQHYVRHPLALEWFQLSREAKTVGEIFKFFLERNKLSPETIQQLPGFDSEHFEQQLASVFPKVHILTIRPE